MKAAFTVAAWYEVSAVCRTPLRTGGTDSDPETVLRDGDGILLIQGSSIAGALREWLERDGGDAEILFGSSAADGQIRPGRLRISDGRFAPDAVTALRPRLKLEPKSRTAEDGKKYDMASVQTGARFDFHIIWLGGEAQKEGDLRTVERLLSALHSGDICLGGQKSNGFGLVSLEYRKRVYTLSDSQDRQDWLDRKPPEGEPITPSQLADGQEVRFILRFHTDSLLVKAGTVELAEEGGGDSRQVTVPILEGGGPGLPGSLGRAGRPVIPGSSVKGAVRARVEKIAALKGLPVSEMEAMFGRMGQGGEDTGAAGVVRFRDIPLPDGQRTRVKRIRINRFTGGVMKTGLFTEEPASTRYGGGEPAELRLSVPADRKTACALLLYALRDLAWKLYGLGSGRAVGRGYLDASELEIRCPDGGRTVFRFLDGFRIQTEGSMDAVREWLAALETEAACWAEQNEAAYSAKRNGAGWEAETE